MTVAALVVVVAVAAELRTFVTAERD